MPVASTMPPQLAKLKSIKPTIKPGQKRLRKRRRGFIVGFGFGATVSSARVSCAPAACKEVGGRIIASALSSSGSGIGYVFVMVAKIWLSDVQSSKKAATKKN